MSKVYLSFALIIILALGTNAATEDSQKTAAPDGIQKPAEQQSSEPNFVSMNPDTVMAKYGDKKLTLGEIKYIMPLVTPESARQFAQQWIDLQMMYEAAQKKGLTNDPKIKLMSELGTKSLFAREFMNKVAEEVNVPESQVREYYEKNKNTDPQLTEPNRYSFTHIRTETPAEANIIIKEIKEGREPDTVAKERSLAPDGVDGGVVRKMPESQIGQQYGKVFLNQLKAAKEGDIIGPIKFGSNRLEIAQHQGKLSSRIASYDKVKDSIRQRLVQKEKTQATQRYIDELKTENESKVYMSPLIEEPKEKTEGNLSSEPNLPIDKTKSKSDNAAQNK